MIRYVFLLIRHQMLQKSPKLPENYRISCKISFFAGTNFRKTLPNNAKIECVQFIVTHFYKKLIYKKLVLGLRNFQYSTPQATDVRKVSFFTWRGGGGGVRLWKIFKLVNFSDPPSLLYEYNFSDPCHAPPHMQ